MDWLLLPAETVALLLGAAFLAGWVDAIAGGGGLLMLPALLSAGVPPHLALGTNKLAGTFGTYTASRVCMAQGILPLKVWALAGFATLQGAAIGTVCAWLLSADWLEKLLPIFIVAIALYALFHPQAKASSDTHTAPKPKRSSSWLLGSSLGFYDGFFGPGTGTFWMSAAVSHLQLNWKQAVCLARSMNFISNIVSFTTFALLSSVDFVLGLGLGAALMLGAYIGVHSALHYGARLIRPVFLIVVLATAGRLAWKAWF